MNLPTSLIFLEVWNSSGPSQIPSLVVDFLSQKLTFFLVQFEINFSQASHN